MRVLTTPRLALDELTDADASFLVALLNDPDFLRYIGDRGVRNEDDARVYLAKGPFDSYRRHGHGLWLVRRRDDAERLGICGLLKRDTLDDVDLGFAFLPQFRGQGYARESAAAVLAHARDALGIARVVAIASRDNDASARLLEAVGLRFERLVRLGVDSPELALFVPPTVRR